MSLDNGASTVRIVASIVGVIIAAVAVIVSIKAAIASSRKKAKAAASSKSGVVAKAKGKETFKADIKKWYKAALDKIVAARLATESSVEPGEPVFLSHYISQGQFRHWVLHAHDYKYELRQTEVGDSNTPGVYEATIGPSGFNFKAYKESVITRYSPEVGHYFYIVEDTDIMTVVEAMDIMTADTTDIFTSEITDLEATYTMMVEAAADTEADTPVS
ncbi:hypothetical protein TsFJ059_002144 [Trichoderma semiorbis]|uniref:Uncharacterized protein n=1 Tax=Trichoderma semiorbis TaxID=1491008 RepID=A0A9P8HIN5_9HYPO|nr:hypothetical protein TsFJ059_002144 [Trichoderma semiorbis]